MSHTPNLNALKSEVAVLDALLQDPHPGLSGWDRMLVDCLVTISSFYITMQVDEGMIDRALKAPVPGGSTAEDWFMWARTTPKAQVNIRGVVRQMLAAALCIKS